MTDGFFNILKPAGPTASDVVVKVRRRTGLKTGHLGTLDPGAAGVLPVAVGKGTKLFDLLVNKTKRYRAFFTFGTSTDTLDSYGTVCDTGLPVPDINAVKTVLPDLTGELNQIPPQYSAKSVDGVRAYRTARKGGYVELEPRKVYVSSFELIKQTDEKTFVFDVTCGGGTYIRALARDLAAKLGTVAFMSGLIRLSSGAFNIENSVTLDELTGGDWEKYLLPTDFPLNDFSKTELDEKYFKPLSNGVKIDCPSFDGLKRVYCGGVFLGLASAKNNLLKLEYNLCV